MKEQHDILTGMLNCTEAASILLAMTTSLADENALKELLQKQGYKFAVTELGGDASKSEFREKSAAVHWTSTGIPPRTS